ncbi:ice-structuring glycoprotein-like [Prorops nasuta]|uniref:ice-structuring glycoprotein-like n=1 Tax=Prorops nasuta TaxID=863751 RepID=UPI0034CD3601
MNPAEFVLAAFVALAAAAPAPEPAPAPAPAPKPGLLAAPVVAAYSAPYVAAPIAYTAPAVAVPAPIVTSRSSQVIARNYNTLAAAPLAAAPLAYAAPAAYTAPAVSAPLAYTAPAVSAPYAYAASAFGAPLAYASPLAYKAPLVAAAPSPFAYAAPAYTAAAAPYILNKYLLLRNLTNNPAIRSVRGENQWIDRIRRTPIRRRSIVLRLLESLNMNSYVTVIVVVLGVLRSSTAGVVPAAVAAPLIAAPAALAAPAAIGYTKAVPYNVPPYASRIDINTRNIAAPLIATPVAQYVAAPGGPIAAAYAAPAAPFAAAAYSAPFPAAYAEPALTAPGFVDPATLGPFAQRTANTGQIPTLRSVARTQTGSTLRPRPWRVHTSCLKLTTMAELRKKGTAIAIKYLARKYTRRQKFLCSIMIMRDMLRVSPPARSTEILVDRTCDHWTVLRTRPRKVTVGKSLRSKDSRIFNKDSSHATIRTVGFGGEALIHFSKKLNRAIEFQKEFAQGGGSMGTVVRGPGVVYRDERSSSMQEERAMIPPFLTTPSPSKPPGKIMFKCFLLVAALVAVSSAGIVPAAVPAALTVGTYATSYNAHAINHAVAAPYVAAPAVAAAPALAYSALPAAYSAYPAYSAYSAYPAAYSAPIIAGRR